MNAIFVDIDLHNVDENLIHRYIDSISYFVKEDILKPTYIILSGRGVHIYYCLKEDAPKTLFIFYKDILEKTNLYFKEYFNFLENVDIDISCAQANRVLRLPGTKNTNVNNICYIAEENQERYTLTELAEVFTVTQKKEKKVHILRNERNLIYCRMKDLETIASIRKDRVVGYREKLLFLYRNYANQYFCDPAIALEKTLELNKKLAYPLSEKEILCNTSSGDGKYKFTNEKLIEFLDISEDEQKQLITIISKDEKLRRYNQNRRAKRRDQDGLTHKKREIVERQKQIYMLRMQGYKLKEIAEILNIPYKTVEYYAGKIKLGKNW